MQGEIKKHFNVCAAVITRKNKNGETEIFCAKRPGPKMGRELNETNFKWEFPGGKIEEGESREKALEREIYEEFGAEIIVGNYILTVEHEYKNFAITMHGFFCTLKDNNQKLILKEHLESKWCLLNDLDNLDWAAADIPIMEKIKIIL